MDYETQMATAELDKYREDLVQAFDYLHEHPYHTFVKMPYATETSELLKDFQINHAEKIISRLFYLRHFDQQNVSEELLEIFTGPFSKMSSENAEKLSGYVADILNETYKSKFFNPTISTLQYSIWFEQTSVNGWHLDGLNLGNGRDEGVCNDNQFQLIYPLKGPSTLFNDPHLLLNGLELHDKDIYKELELIDGIYDSTKDMPFSFFDTLNYCPVEVECAQAGHASIHTYNSMHSAPEFDTPRLVLTISRGDKDTNPLYALGLDSYRE